MSTTLLFINMPGLRAAAGKNQSDSKRGFLPNSIAPNTGLTGEEGVGSSKPSYAASVPETSDAPENREMFGTLGAQDDTQLLRGAKIRLASARFFLGSAPTVPGASWLARKYDPLFSHG